MTVNRAGLVVHLVVTLKSDFNTIQFSAGQFHVPDQHFWAQLGDTKGFRMCVTPTTFPAWVSSCSSRVFRTVSVWTTVAWLVGYTMNDTVTAVTY